MNSNNKSYSVSKRLWRLNEFAILIVYAVMVLIFTIIKPNYFSLMNIRSVLIQTSFLGIISSGMTLVMLTGGVDLSVGAVAGMATLGGLWPVVFNHMPLGVGYLIALGLAIGIGLINAICISRLGVAPFVASLATMFLAQGMQYLFSDGGMSISYGFPSEYCFLGSGSVANIPMPVIIYFTIFMILLILTEFAPTGRYMRGTGLNQFTSQLSGIRIRFYTLLSYILCSILAAILGLVLGASQTYVSPDHGSSFMMDSLLAVLLGKTLMNGNISIYATAFGALFLRSFESGLSMIGIPVTVLSVCKGSLMVIILLLAMLRQKTGGKN